jgi:hypothetical protein
VSEPALRRDLLVAGPDEPERPSAAARVLAACLVLAALLAVRSDAQAPSQQAVSAGGDPLQLVLRVGAPRLLSTTSLWRTREQRTPVVEVLNAGPRPVRVTSATLTPGLWQVRVLDDGPLRPRSRAALALHRLVDCRRGIGDGAVPQDLVLVASVDGRSHLRRVAVRDLRGPDGRPLVHQLRAASVECGVRRGYDAG